MPMLRRPDTEIHYEVHGQGFPILLYAPGGLRSNIEFWGPGPDGAPRSWMDPRTALSDRFTVITMDQRNAGKSVADVKPDRVASAVLQNPIGLHENRDTWDAAVKAYGETVRARDPSIPQSAIDSFGHNMFGNDFVFSVSRDFVRACNTPLFLQPGTDKAHPGPISDEITALAPNIEVQKDWRGPAFLAESIKRVRAFLEKHMPQA